MTLEQVSGSPGDQRLLRKLEACVRRVVGELGEEASAEEGGEQGGDQDVDEGEHDARRAVGVGVAASIPDRLGRLEGEEDSSHEVLDP